ncbi:MAG: glycosyltransferase family 2 protein [Bdellovibrionales bacterium]|nr:glycosyltransferase family 2 protein [Bdellovibrionales bacterium]
MQPVSALLIIKNEEQYIERALASVAWCDEIVVIDAMSTDRTKEICIRKDTPWAKTVRFIERPWLGFAGQRNFALAQASHEWVFFLDGDEACSPGLETAIKQVLAENPKKQFKIRRQEYFLKKPIHHGIWNPSTPIRLFPKSGVKFIGEVHEGVASRWETGLIDAPILHVEDLRIERFLNKLNHYTTLQAQADYDSGHRTSVLRILLSFPAMFYKNYFYYGAYKDGVHGVIISILEGVSRTVRHLKIWQITQVSKLN